MNRLQSHGTVRALDGEAMTVEAVISTGDIARDDAIIDPAGWDFTNYRRNPVVLFNHDDSHGFPVARTSHGPTPNGAELIATAEFDREDPEAARLFGKIQRGFINSTSVRWLPKRWEYIEHVGPSGEKRAVLVFREQELLEWSFVNIPADPGAVILRSDGGAIDTSEFAPPEKEPSSQLEPGAEDTEEPQDDEDQEERHYDLTPVVARLEALLEQRGKPFDLDNLVVKALAKATGKTEERIRHQLAAGGFK